MTTFSQESMSNSHRVESVPIMSSKPRPSTAAQSKANPPRTFHAFPNLLPELQNMIWRYSLPGPRVIRAAYVQRGGYAKNPFVFRDARPPTALHACQNSRQEALKFYNLLSESVSANDDFEYNSEFECNSADDSSECHPTGDNQSRDSGSRILRSRSIYFDPALDTIYLMTPFCQKGPLYVDFAEGFTGINQIQSLAIDYYPGSHIIEELFHIIFCSEENLTEILLAVGPGAYSLENHLDGRGIKFAKPKYDTISIPIRMYEPQLPRQKWNGIEADLREQFNEMFPRLPSFRVVEVEDNWGC